MDWDKPFDITKNPDGTYTKWGKVTPKKPRWTIGSPRMVLVILPAILGALWLHYDWILFTPIISVVSIIILIVFSLLQLYLIGLAWEAF
jgi:hypothetical protein